MRGARAVVPGNIYDHFMLRARFQEAESRMEQSWHLDDHIFEDYISLHWFNERVEIGRWWTVSCMQSSLTRASGCSTATVPPSCRDRGL